MVRSPYEEDPVTRFTSRSETADTCARTGQFTTRGRPALATPNYFAITSRGVVPHVAQDVLQDDTSIPGVYVALEDFIEKAPEATPPILKFKPPGDASPLRHFLALPDDRISILGPRRIPAITCPNANTSTALEIYTSVGFSSLNIDQYVQAALHLRPDILIGLADIPYGAERVSQKRKETMTDRTARWMLEQTEACARSSVSHASIPLFAPTLPMSAESQQWYLDDLAERMLPGLAGLVLYSAEALPGLPAALTSLPRLGLTEPQSPQKILDEIAQGVDMFTIPFVGIATDAGIALSFRFPVPHEVDSASFHKGVSWPLGDDMWSESHTTDLSPLSRECTCYACENHHRAYLKHLLSAREMLAWVLLQIHNHHVMDDFFQGVRNSIEAGTFENDRATFEKTYEPSFPARTGTGPRVRGYQYKSEGPGEGKRNPKAFNILEDARSIPTETIDSNSTFDVQDVEGVDLAKEADIH